MSTKRAHLNNADLLRWARTEVGLPRRLVASMLGMPEEPYAQAEQGRHHLTFRQLEKFAALTARGVQTLYLPEPPPPTTYAKQALAHCAKYGLPDKPFLLAFTARFAEAAAAAAAPPLDTEELEA